MATVELHDLTKEFGTGSDAITAVEGLDVTIRDGEFLVLVGPSGCGKSTTLRMIAGLESVTRGDIRLDGTSIVDRKPRDRDIAMVFQNYALYPHMTARENMSFGLKMNSDMSGSEIATRVEDTAEMMGIRDLLDDRPKELSGGQQQRVALGRAIVREPEVFLMDEPLSNLDAKLRSQMRTELQSLQNELGVTTVYVTHDQTEAMTMGDRIAILDDGELQQVGTPLECYHRPANRFVAGFIGSPSMNFLDVTRDGDVLRHPAFEYELPETDLDAVGEETDLVFGIRPEDIKLVDGGDVRARVNVVEPLGDLTHIYLDFQGDTCTATVDGDQLVASGQSVDVAFPPERVHLFSRATGEALKNSEVAEDRELMAMRP